MEEIQLHLNHPESSPVVIFFRNELFQDKIMGSWIIRLRAWKPVVAARQQPSECKRKARVLDQRPGRAAPNSEVAAPHVPDRDPSIDDVHQLRGIEACSSEERRDVAANDRREDSPDTCTPPPYRRLTDVAAK